MSRSIEIIDKYTVQFNKEWTEEDLFFASCLDVVVSLETGTGHADIRVVCKRALLSFMEQAFPYITKSPLMETYRKSLYANIKLMYDNQMKEFISGPYQKLKYDRELYDHQKETLCMSLHRRFNFWALDMGLGKTISSASMSKLTSAIRTIIISPSLVKFNWLEDMTKQWGFGIEYWTVLDREKRNCVYAFRERFVVLNYEQVQKFFKYLTSDVITHIIVDEAHYAKNKDAGRSKWLNKLIEASNGARVTFLSGTPVTNRIDDMFNYLKMAGHPLGKDFKRFKADFAKTANVNGGQIVGAKNVDRLRALTANFMIRKRSEDCLDLPEMIVNNLYLEFGDVAEYAATLDELRSIREKYDQATDDEKRRMMMSIRNNIHSLNRIVSTSKVTKVKELVDNLNEQGEKVIIFCSYRDSLTRLEQLFGDRCVKIDGRVSSHKRMMLINRFKEDPDCNVFLANETAGGIGINLVNARYVFHMNFTFTPDKMDQARKRAHRPGQSRTVFVYHLICRGTIDEHIHKLMNEKNLDINDLIDDEDSKGLIDYQSLPNLLFNTLIQ